MTGLLSVAPNRITASLAAIDIRRWLFFFVLMVTIVFSPSINAETETQKQRGNFSSAAAIINGDQVKELDQVIGVYERIASNGGWPLVSSDSGLIPGKRHPGVRELRRRLRITADYRSNMGADPYYFDPSLLLALQHFQMRHGLRQTAYLDRLTLRELNQPVEYKLMQLKAARIAWSELAIEDENAFVWVNLPEARVAAIEEKKIDLNIRAIVGHPSRQTPTLDSVINRVVANPLWSVPKSIAVRDILPKVQQDTDYLLRNQLKVFRSWDPDEDPIDP
ncbi:MAG: L,D-transpeptidase family protein, partial [Gammaproteobacteria bacterium]|nr:L,D-transpeptidase family protein [Gammaproteobacteria bacterium]